jgi:hypothetical protein
VNRRAVSHTEAGESGELVLSDSQVLRRGLAADFSLLVAVLGALIERTEAGPLDRRDVDKDVLAAVVGLNEAVSLGRVEPFNGTDSHVSLLHGGLRCAAYAERRPSGKPRPDTLPEGPRLPQTGFCGQTLETKWRPIGLLSSMHRRKGPPIMVRYFFDVRDGDAFVRDDEGEELLDIADAQIEAAGTLTDLAKGLSMRAPNRSGHQMSVEVRDGDGALFQARFTFSRSTQ